jgi:hypothetical protein
MRTRTDGKGILSHSNGFNGKEKEIDKQKRKKGGDIIRINFSRNSMEHTLTIWMNVCSCFRYRYRTAVIVCTFLNIDIRVAGTTAAAAFNAYIIIRHSMSLDVHARMVFFK